MRPSVGPVGAVMAQLVRQGPPHRAAGRGASPVVAAAIDQSKARAYAPRHHVDDPKLDPAGEDRFFQGPLPAPRYAAASPAVTGEAQVAAHARQVSQAATTKVELATPPPGLNSRSPVIWGRLDGVGGASALLAPEIGTRGTNLSSAEPEGGCDQ